MDERSIEFKTMIFLNIHGKYSKWYAFLRLIRINSLIGFFLLLWPTLWSLWLSKKQAPDFYILVLFILSVFLTRSFGCIINDCIDKDFDRYVNRTRHRPMSCGIINIYEALILFFVLIFISLMIVVILSFKVQTMLLSLSTLLLICLYPYTKRCVSFPQFFLGVTFGCSVFIVFSVLDVSLCSVLPWLLFLINIVWVMIYDTEYAMVDRDDDIYLNIRSSAVFLGNYERVFIGVLQLIMLLLFVVVGLIVELNIFFYGSLIGVGVLFVWQQMLIHCCDRDKCFLAFLTNNYVGFLVFCGIYVDLSMF